MYREQEVARRWSFGLTATLLLAVFCLLVLSSQGSAEGRHAPQGTTLFLSPLQLNYAEDWVAGSTEPSATVWVTVTDDIGATKDEAVVSPGASGEFFVGCEDWFSGTCPDILPGDHAYVRADGAMAEISPIGAILVDSVDTAGDTVSGTVHAGGFPASMLLDVYCEVWEDMGPAIATQAEAGGGSFTCDFDGTGWDLEWGQRVALLYFEPDGDAVSTFATWPWMRVNLGHDWVGGDYPAGHTLAITVTDSGDTPKGTAVVGSEFSAGWTGPEGFVAQEGDWSPTTPDLQPGDVVFISADNGYTRTITAGTISATVDAAGDEITGQIWAPFEVPLPVECQPWGAWEAGIDAPVKESWAQPDGTIPFECSWDPATEWDVQPGQEIAVMYLEPDHDRVIDVFAEPAPHLRIEKRGFGALAEGGNAHFEIELWNEGNAAAEDVVVTDVMEGLSYLYDTSGYPRAGAGSGPISWEAGTLDPGQSTRFALFAEVAQVASQTVTNTASVATSTPYDRGEPWEKTSTWVGHVTANDTYLRVDKGAWTDNPAPDQDVVFVLQVCNEGSTGSTAVTLSDELDPALSLGTWWADEAGWTELASDPGHLTVTIPSVAGFTCSRVYLRAHVSPAAQPGDRLANTARIEAANDLSPGDNEAFWEGQVDEPRQNLSIEKGWGGGQLVPGGEIRYGLHYQNTGNVPVGPVLMTDTFPVSTTFLGAWQHDPWGGHPFEPVSVDGEHAVWAIPGLDNGESGEVEVILAVDPAAEPGTALVNTAEISRLPEEVRHDDNWAVWTEVLQPSLPNLRVRIGLEWHGDGQIQYQIQFENIGSEPVGDVWLTDVLPVGTYWDGWQVVEFDPERLTGWEYNEASRTFLWNFSELLPGESGGIRFHANLEEPGTLLRWYTNTTEITLPPGDPTPLDNSVVAVTFSGGEVRRVGLWLNPTGPSSMWGEAVAGRVVTVTTPLDEFHTWADPGCEGCWQIEDVGWLAPGDTVEVAAGKGLLPVTIAIPAPFSAEVDTTTDEVSGQIGGWGDRPVEVHGEWPAGYRVVLSNPSGDYAASFPDIPRGGSGHVRIVDWISHAEVIYQRPFASLDLILEANYGHDGVEGRYEAGHTLWLTVTDQIGAVKARAELETQAIPWWEGQTGFSTHLGDPWMPEPPDLVPRDWVHARMDNGQVSMVQVGEISGTLDLGNDTVAGTVYAMELEGMLPARCSVWEEGGPTIDFEVEADHGAYLCDLGARGWDLQRDQTVAVQYQEPDGDWVINVFRAGWRVYLPLVLRGY